MGDPLTSGPPAATEALPVAPDEPLCPLCLYNLRGLAQPRCPECGYAFTWDEVIDPKRRLHPYLFEHRSGQDPWSAVKTFIGGLSPTRFWRTLHPVQPSRPERLALYFFVILLIVALPAILVLASEVLWRQQTAGGWFRRSIIGAAYRPGPTTYAEILMRPLTRMPVGILVFVTSAWMLLLPALNLAALALFQITLKRAKLRFHHLARCIVYAYDFVLLFALPLIALVLVYHVTGQAPPFRIYLTTGCFLTLAGAWPLYAYRLGRALELYFRFPRPWGTILLMQAVVLFAGLNLWMLFYI